jgi:hypothetical protein
VSFVIQGLAGEVCEAYGIVLVLYELPYKRCYNAEDLLVQSRNFVRFHALPCHGMNRTKCFV